jgi:hypothetical protein
MAISGWLSDLAKGDYGFVVVIIVSRRVVDDSL